MFYEYPAEPYNRKHGPFGYADYHSFKPWLRDEFEFRCVYCLIREKWYHDGSKVFGADHLIPQAVDASKACDFTNLVYSCNRCNSAKGTNQMIVPCQESIGDFLRINPDGQFISINSQEVT